MTDPSLPYTPIVEPVSATDPLGSSDRENGSGPTRLEATCVDDTQYRPDRSLSGARTLPDSLRSAEAKLIYLYVREAGRCTAEELADSLRLTKLSVFPHLRTLCARGLLTAEGAEYVLAERETDPRSNARAR